MWRSIGMALLVAAIVAGAFVSRSGVVEPSGAIGANVAEGEPVTPTSAGLSGAPAPVAVGAPRAAGGAGQVADGARFEGFAREIAAAAPGLVVSDQACAAAVCVLALRVAPGASADAVRQAAFVAAAKEASEIDAQPTFRWGEEDGQVVGYMWFVPNTMTADEARAFSESAQSQVVALGG